MNPEQAAELIEIGHKIAVAQGRMVWALLAIACFILVLFLFPAPRTD